MSVEQRQAASSQGPGGASAFRAVGLLGYLLVALLCAGCGNQRPAATSTELPMWQREFAHQYSAERRVRLEKILHRMEQEAALVGTDEQSVFDILVIHGGGPAGGFAASMFLGFNFEGFLWLHDSWRRRQPTRPFPRLRIWTVVNSTLFVEPETTQPRYPDVARRAIEIALEYERFKALFMLIQLCANIDATEGVEAEVRYVVMPHDMKLPKDRTELADPEIALHMVEVGIQVGRDPSNRTSEYPHYDMLLESIDSST